MTRSVSGKRWSRGYRASNCRQQNQQPIVWPKTLTVAKAYVDQLERSGALPADRIAELRKTIQRAEASKLSSSDRGRLQGIGLVLSKISGEDSLETARLHALAEILEHPSM